MALMSAIQTSWAVCMHYNLIMHISTFGGVLKLILSLKVTLKAIQVLLLNLANSTYNAYNDRSK